MNIALIAHDNRKELMVQFCTAYCGILAQHTLCATANTGIGCLLYFSAVAKLPVQTVAVVGYLEPLSAVVFSAVLLGEAITPVRLMGAALVIGGAIFCELAGKRANAKASIAQTARA